MIRELESKDKTGVLSLAKELGMFDDTGLELISRTLDDYNEGESNELCFVSGQDEIAGVIYCTAEAMTRGTWNVQMLLVSPDSHGQGHGQALMGKVEQSLKVRGAGLLIVETSSKDEFERARAFYEKFGFNEEARIKDFYDAGDDKVIFTKPLKN